jgi:PAS domain S-box-containing protein
VQVVLGAVGLALITSVCFKLGFKLGPVGFAYLLLIALLSLLGSFAASLVLSIAAVACLNYFFAPPLFDLRVDYPEDMLGIAAFATTSLIVTALTTKLRKSADTERQAVLSLRGTRDELDANVRELEQSNKALEAEITERARIERSLRASEARLTALVGSTDEIVYEFDSDGKYLNVWTKDEELLISPPDRLMRSGLGDILAEDAAQHGLEMIRRVLASGEAESFEVARPVKGKSRWFLGRVSPIPSPDGSRRTACCVMREITERKRSEQFLAAQYEVTRVLAESENLESAAPHLLRAIAGIMEWDWGALWTVDRDGSHLQCQAIWRTSGFDSASIDAASRGVAFLPGQPLLGRVWNTAVPLWIADVATERNFVRAAAAANAGLHGAVAFPIVLAEQGLGAVEFFSRQVRQRDEEQLARLAAIGSQIGQFIKRKRAEQALRKSEEEWRELFEHHPAMYFLIDSDGAVLSVNAFGAAQLGHSVTDLVGRSVLDVFVQEDREYVRSNMAACLENIGRPFNWEARKCRKDGSIIWVREHAKALQRPEGILVLVVCEDITERKQGEDALRQSEMSLAEAQRISHTGSFAVRAATREVIWSAEMFRIFGLDRLTKPTLELLLERTHPDDRTSVRSVLERAWKEGGEWEHKHRLLMPDGSVKHLHAVGHPVRNAAGELEFFGAVMDITDAVKAEEELSRLRTELAHVNRVMTLGELTASIAHEINQPLTAVITDASAAVRWLNGQSPNLNEAREALARIQKNGNRAADVIQHIRGLARKSPVQMSEVDLNEVIQNVITVTSNEIKLNRIALRTELAADLPAIRADRVQLQQVVLNLIMNAIEAMGGCEPRELMVYSGQKAPQNVLVSIFDSGPGFDSQNVDCLFEPFYTTKAEGMGMGLAICRSILETHGGRLSARANEPRGAVFEVELPIEEAGPAEK